MKLTLWTIQTEEKWNQMKSLGYLRAEESFIEPSWIEPYSWIEKMMKQRVGPPPEGVKHPIWTWRSYGGFGRMPDLRRGAHLGKGESGVRIKFEYDSDKILLTDFDDWHIVLTDSVKENIENECTVLDNDFIDPKDVKWPWEVRGNDIAMPWERIIQSPDSRLSYIQATLWELKMSEIKEVKFFKSR